MSLTILDPKTKTVIATAEDDRCASGGRIVFDKDGYGYVMGDGGATRSRCTRTRRSSPRRTTASSGSRPARPTFEKDYFHTLPSFTGGRQSIGELDTVVERQRHRVREDVPSRQAPAGHGAGRLRVLGGEGAQDVAHRARKPSHGEGGRGDPVRRARLHSRSPFDGKYYSGESPDGGKTSEIYEIDPATNVAKIKFRMDGYFYGVAKIETK